MKRSWQKLFDLSHKVAIVTGGAGQLGGEYIRTFLAAGASVASFDVAPENPKGNLTEIPSERFLSLKVDVTDRNALRGNLEEVVTRLGNPQILVNNAALDTPPHSSVHDTGPFEKYPEASWQAMIDVNLTGMFLCCQVIGGHMAETSGGSIINISSLYGILSPDQRIYESSGFYKPVAYSVTKAAVLNLTRYLATYWKEKNIRVNTLTLGGVFNNQDEAFMRNYSERVPLGRMARQDEYNGAILFLASDASSYMTGANLVIDGGYSCW